MSKATFRSSFVLFCLLAPTTAALRAQQALPPDFTGVYMPIDPFAQYRRAVPAPTPTDGAVPPPRPVLVLDGREGRPENAPKLTPEYLAKWEVIRQSRMERV